MKEYFSYSSFSSNFCDPLKIITYQKFHILFKICVLKQIRKFIIGIRNCP